MQLRLLLGAFVLAAANSPVSAGIIQNSGTACGSTSGFSLTSITNDNGYSWTGDQDASACLSYDLPYSDEEQGLSDPDPNIGQYGDGLLNGETYTYNGDWVQTGKWWQWWKGYYEQLTGQLPPEDLVDPEDFQDLDGDGNATDPGWIHLAEVMYPEFFGYNYEPTVDYSSSTVGDNTLFIGDLLDIHFDCENDWVCSSGTWSLDTDYNIVDEVQALLGENTFDRLAFVVTKDQLFGSESAPFLIYEFDFTELLFGGELLDLSTAYNLAGNWNMSGFCGSCNEPMRIQAWARDPQDIQVPAPAPLALLLIGGLPLLVRLRMKP